jgi:hypothetical protein
MIERGETRAAWIVYRVDLLIVEVAKKAAAKIVDWLTTMV